MNPAQEPQGALARYLALPDEAYAWQPAQWEGREGLALTSQTWRGLDWKHAITFSEPVANDHPDTAVLFITGDMVLRRDLPLSDKVARDAGMLVATLYDVPNQPIWDKREDDLIAHTFEQYAVSGDETWPLLLPMVKSAVRAMDAIQEAKPQVRRFIVAGASKRGWTTWLVGATGDDRVAGIVPMVIDNLDIPEQIRKQKRDWGRYSPMIADYTDRGLEQLLESSVGKSLVQIVDPHAHLGGLRAPVLMVNGANDPYWTVDALSVYYRAIPTPASAIIVPNSGHGLEDVGFWMPTVTAFARSCAGEFDWPRWQDWQPLVWDRSQVALRVPAARGLRRVAVWTAASPDLDFHRATWARSGPFDARRPPKEPYRVFLPELRNGTAKAAAAFVQAEFRVGGRKFSLTSPVQVQDLR